MLGFFPLRRPSTQPLLPTRHALNTQLHQRPFMLTSKLRRATVTTVAFLASAAALHASEADLKIPPLTDVKFAGLCGVTGYQLMYMGILMCAIGAIFGLLQYMQTKALPVHKSMADVSQTIWETCKTYLFQQGKFLAILWVLIAACIFFYF